MKKESPRRRSGLLPKGQKNIGQKPAAPKRFESRPYRANGRIRAKLVDLRDENGMSRGVVTVEEALNVAREIHSDLIQIGFKEPAICILKDFGKFMFEERRAERKRMGAKQ